MAETMLKEKAERMAEKKKSKGARMNVWHRAMLDVLKNGKSDTESIVTMMKEQKRAYHSRGTLRGYLTALHGWGLVEEIETERVRDKGGRMTIRVWRLSAKGMEKAGQPAESSKAQVEEAEVEEAKDGFGPKPKKKNHGRMMNIWHRALVDILGSESPLSKTELIKRVKERGAYQSDQTLRGYVTDLKNFGLIEAVEDVRVADDRGNMSIPVWKLVEAKEPEPEAAKVNQPTEGA
jgi:hypothetical protein